MKEQNYYEIKGDGYNFYPVKLIKETESDLIIESLPEKKQTTLNRKNYTLRELSVLQSHLDRLGFENKNEIQTIKGVNVFPIYMFFGKDNMNLNLTYFGYKVLEAKNFAIFKSKYLEKYEELTKISDPDYDIKYLEIQNEVKKELDLTANINELFSKLGNLNFVIENKDIIVSGK